MWPRIASGFLSLQAGRLDEAERRLRRVIDFLGDRQSFGNYRKSAEIGLGLIALDRDDRVTAHRLLDTVLADPVHLYPYTHVQALLGLARLADREGNLVGRDALLRRALLFAGRRSLLEEYFAVVLELASVRPSAAPVAALLESVLVYARAIGLEAATRQLEQALAQVA